MNVANYIYINIYMLKLSMFKMGDTVFGFYYDLSSNVATGDGIDGEKEF